MFQIKLKLSWIALVCWIFSKARLSAFVRVVVVFFFVFFHSLNTLINPNQRSRVLLACMCYNITIVTKMTGSSTCACRHGSINSFFFCQSGAHLKLHLRRRKRLEGFSSDPRSLHFTTTHTHGTPDVRGVDSCKWSKILSASAISRLPSILPSFLGPATTAHATDGLKGSICAWDGALENTRRATRVRHVEKLMDVDTLTEMRMQI